MPVSQVPSKSNEAVMPQVKPGISRKSNRSVIPGITPFIEDNGMYYTSPIWYGKSQRKKHRAIKSLKKRVSKRHKLKK